MRIPVGAVDDGGGARHPHQGSLREIPTGRRATTLAYSPEPDGMADPGEVVWTWVPFEDDPGRGKDRPLLVVGRRGNRLQGLMLSSREPDQRDQHDWFELGPGSWDREDRTSYLCLDRLFELDETDIRREGAVLDSTRFWRVGELLRARYGWR